SDLLGRVVHRFGGARLFVGGAADGGGVSRKVEVRRSARSKRTVSTYFDGDTMVVLIPARMSSADEEHWVAEMERKLLRGKNRRVSPVRQSDEALMQRCRELSAQ